MLSEEIVVIEDDPRIVRSLEMMLPEYEMVHFSNGKEALEYLVKPNLINLVLLDVMLPGMNGLSVLKQIKEANKDIAVIMMTAFGSMDVAVQALRYHADDFIEKPFDSKQLKEKVQNILRNCSPAKLNYKTPQGKIERIKKFVRRNYSQSTLDHIAEEMSLSTKYISRLFNKQNETSFRRYKLNVKIDIAKALLKNSGLMVYEVSNQLGYQNPESFMRIFKRETGLTPSSYREKFQSEAVVS
ncbi:MAG: DNA-binding response regulator [Candidatus Omnitrophica bacterium]|nr:DNA-binding response regulator [Candidatus Omnitrophota bacterium]